MGQRACGEKMSGRIINWRGWLDRASPLAQQEAVRGGLQFNVRQQKLEREADERKLR